MPCSPIWRRPALPPLASRWTTEGQPQPSATTPRRPACGSSSTTGPDRLRQLPETMCGGVGLLDYDGDGWLDVYVVQGGPFPPARRRPPAATGSSATAATAPSRTSPSGRASPALPRRLRPRRGRGRLSTTTAIPTSSSRAGGRMRSIATGATARSRTSRAQRGPGRRPRLADLGGLRRPRRRRRPRPLRLPLPRLGRGPPDALPRLAKRTPGVIYCDPSRFPARARPRLPQRRRPVHRRDDRGRASSTATAGAWAWSRRDLDDDGRIDLYVANDMTANFLFRNLGGFRFEEIGQIVGGRQQRRRGVQGGHGRRLRRPRRRRPARPGRHEFLQRVDHASTGTSAAASSATTRARSAWRVPTRLHAGLRDRRSWTSTTTAGSTWPLANGHVDDFRPADPLRDARAAPGSARRRPVDRRLRDGPGRPGRSSGSAAGWPRATWTTTAGSTC